MPALTIVGDVVSLREHLRWFDTQPLFGKRVLITRPEGPVRWLARALREGGAEPLEAADHADPARRSNPSGCATHVREARLATTGWCSPA